MTKVTEIVTRKADHVRINLEENVDSGLTTGLEKYHFIHQALPDLNLREVSLTHQIFDHLLQAPLLISSMTGGTVETAKINRILAEAAQETGIAMGLGSQRVALDHPEMAYSFQVRQVAPDILLFANLGAVQLNYSYGISHCQKAVDMVEADALILHLNALQEAVQPEGQTHFGGLLNKIEAVCRALPVPVIVKEVGWGISEHAAHQLAQVGVKAIDVAGAGGTSWTQVEKHRAQNESQARLAAVFVDWGIPTAESILNVRRVVPEMTIFASGGLRNGIEIAKCIALGAQLAGMAKPFLIAAHCSLAETILTINEIIRELHVCMFAAGARDIAALSNTSLSHT